MPEDVETSPAMTMCSGAGERSARATSARTAGFQDDAHRLLHESALRGAGPIRRGGGIPLFNPTLPDVSCQGRWPAEMPFLGEPYAFATTSQQLARVIRPFPKALAIALISRGRSAGPIAVLLFRPGGTGLLDEAKLVAGIDALGGHGAARSHGKGDEDSRGGGRNEVDCAEHTCPPETTGRMRLSASCLVRSRPNRWISAAARRRDDPATRRR